MSELARCTLVYICKYCQASVYIYLFIYLFRSSLCFTWNKIKKINKLTAHRINSISSPLHVTRKSRERYACAPSRSVAC